MSIPTPLLCALALASGLQAALPTLADTIAVYRQDFDGLITTGTAEFSKLPDGWTVVETGTNANTSLAADSGQSNSGNSYSYGEFGSTDRALGLLASGSLTGRIEFRLVNNTGKAIDSVWVRFSAEQWRLGGSTTDSMAASVQINHRGAVAAAGLTIRADQGNTNTRNPNANVDAQTVQSMLAVKLSAWDTLELAWADVNATGNDDAWGIDNFELRFTHFGTDTTIAPDTVLPSGILPIHAIQGSDSASPYLDSTVSFAGIVTSDFTASTGLKGFHVQTPDDGKDDDPKTSEGIFVFLGSGTAGVGVGDSVLVTGKVLEYYGLTEISFPQVVVLASGMTLPVATDLVLPLDSLRGAERWEGMRVRLPQRLVVTGNYTLGRYGEMVVSPRRQMAPTQVALPGAPALAALSADSLSRLTINDGSNVQNPAWVGFPTGGLSAANTLRTGDQVEGLVGILDYGFGLWTLQPTAAPTFVKANARTAAPIASGGDVRVASFNVLNYFTTLGTGAQCGPSRSLGCRGANDSLEFARQKSKIVAAILALDADIVGLMEIENHPTDSALLDLVRGLNDASQPGTWKHVSTDPLGTDAIKVAQIYRASRVEPTDSVASLLASIDPDFADNFNRVPLAQTFRDKATCQKFTVVVNHLKSKGSACANDPDIGDGQGNCNQVRTRAAKALAKWVESRPTGTSSTHALMIGDFNAYAKEDPIAALQGAGLVNLAIRDEGDSAYSYQFGSAFGMLDHAFASPSLAGFAHARHWAINADEPTVLNYNREYKSAAQIDSFFRPDPYASSDHDPIVVDLDFTPTSAVAMSARASLSVSRTPRGLVLEAGAALAGARYQILSPSGERIGEGALDGNGRSEFRSRGAGAAVVRLHAVGGIETTRLVVMP